MLKYTKVLGKINVTSSLAPTSEGDSPQQLLCSNTDDQAKATAIDKELTYLHQQHADAAAADMKVFS